MAFISTFTGATVTSSSTFFSSTPVSARRPAASAKATTRALLTPDVDDFMARAVTKQYIQKACPTGVPPIQCIEGNTFDQPWAARTLKRQSELRFNQLPTAVQVHNFYETRKAALVAAHGCNHEEGRVVAFPTMASAMLIGQAESERACSRYFDPADDMERHMLRAVENRYMAAVNGSGVFSTACTDGQARYEAYLMQERGKAAQFRAKQYSVSQREGMKFASRRQALSQKGHDCSAEEVLYAKYPIVASAMRPTFGYYRPFVTNPVLNPYGLGVMRPQWNMATLAATASTAVALLGYAMTYAVPLQ